MESPTILCTPCIRESNIEDAIKYCVDCNENLCRRCLREHIKANATKAHQLIAADDKPEVALSWSRDKPKDDYCQRHPGNALCMFCEDHQLICCGECVDIEHNSCERVIDTVTACYEVVEADYAKMSADAEIVQRELEVARTARYKDKANSRRNTANALSSIRTFREQINTLLDNLQKLTVDVVNTNCIEEDERANSDIHDIDAMVQSLVTTLSHMKAPDLSDKEMFSFLVKGRKLVTSAQHLEESVAKHTGKEINVFTKNDKIIEFLSHVHEFGRVSVGQSIKLRLKGEADVHDDSACDIQGCVQQKDNKIVLTDHANRNLKILKESLTNGGKLDIKIESGTSSLDGPFDVCFISDTQVAVSLDRDKMIQILDMDNTSAEPDVIEIDEVTRGVTYSFLYDELYVCCGGGSYAGEGLGHIRVYDLKGKLLNIFKTSERGRQLALRPMHVAVSPDGTKIHIADADKGVLTIDRRGKLLACFTAPELVEARGLCLDYTGHVIVCGYQSHNVIQIGDDGQKYFVLLTEADGIKFPTSVCFRSKTSGLAVTMNNRVMVFDPV